MPTEPHERLADAYPASDIERPSAEELWHRGRRRHRHRGVAIAVVATAAVAAVGFGVAGLTPPRPAPAPVISEPSELDEEATSDTTDQDERSVPEPARPGDVPATEDVPEPADG